MCCLGRGYVLSCVARIGGASLPSCPCLVNDLPEEERFYKKFSKVLGKGQCFVFWVRARAFAVLCIGVMYVRVHE